MADPRVLMRRRHLLWTITVVCAAVLPSGTLASPNAPVPNQAGPIIQVTSSPLPSADLPREIAELKDRDKKLEGQINELRSRPRDTRDMLVELTPWLVLGLVGHAAVAAWFLHNLAGRIQDYLVVMEKAKLEQKKEENKTIQLQNDKLGEVAEALEKILTALLSEAVMEKSVVALKASEAKGFLEGLRRAAAPSKP